MAAKSRCLVADPHPLTGEGIRCALAGRFEVDSVGEPDEAIEAVESVGGYEIVIVGVSSYGSSFEGPRVAIGAIRDLRRISPGIGIVANADSTERRMVVEATEAGADAYVCKISPASRFLAAVDAALESETYIDEAVGSVAELAAAPTPRQRQILQLFSEGCTTEQAAELLRISPDTVRTHAKAVIARVGAHDRTHAVAVAMRAGLIR